MTLTVGDKVVYADMKIQRGGILVWNQEILEPTS